VDSSSLFDRGARLALSIADRMRRSSGFTLVEVLVAMTIAVVAVGALAYLGSAATAVNRTARRSTVAALLASDKLEHLRALAFDDGELAPSPADALQADADGFHDTPAEGYRRRWFIAPLPGYPLTARVIHVVVSTVGDAGEASLVTIKARKAE
jgi:prepilin-type N-terminal cleavage/methylation domain-containing protein